jgi:hypothetical protein
MAITHSNAVRNAVANTVVDAVDALGVGTGTLNFRAAADAVASIATLPFQNPAFGAAGVVTVGLATANPITDDTTAEAGTVTHFDVKDSTAATIFQGTVSITTGVGDIKLSSVEIGTNDTISVSLLTYTAPL